MNVAEFRLEGKGAELDDVHLWLPAVTSCTGGRSGVFCPLGIYR